MVYAQDLRWWAKYGGEVEQTCKGERWNCAREMDGVHWIEAVDDVGLCMKPGRIHYGGNSGYQAIGLAYTWGAAKIILLGYDMQRGPKGESHHHGDHGDGLPNPPADMREWCNRMIQLGADLRRQGVLVINATRCTALTCFEPMPIERALLHGNKTARTAALLLPTHLKAERAAFEYGLAAAGYEIVGRDQKSDVSVVWGTQKDRPTGTTLLVAENAYVGPGCALALGGHNGSGKRARASSERLERLGVDLKPWRTDGKYVLVCPNRGIGENPPPAGWLENTVAQLKRATKYPIKVRPHPGNWKVNPPKVPLADDLKGAVATVIWNSAAGVHSLIEGVPVICTAPTWICKGAAYDGWAEFEQFGIRGEDFESSRRRDMLSGTRRLAFEDLAAAQFTLDEISSGEALRSVLGGELTVLCVLRMGGDYNPEYVRKLRDGVARHLKIPHRFVCLSDVPVPCERIPLKHGWKGWWSKLEIFRPDVVTGPTLFLDLDTIIVDELDAVTTIPYEFAMLNIRAKDTKVGNSGAMWMTKPFPHVYERFAEKPDYWIDFHERNAKDRYMGDQAFISDCFPYIPKLHHALPGFFLSYKYDKLQEDIPAGCSVVCFGGKPRPHQAGGWVQQAWV